MKNANLSIVVSQRGLPKFLLTGVAAVALAFSAMPAMAKVIHYSAEMSSAKEVPPHKTDGTGMVMATYDTSSKAFDYTVTYDKLTGPATAAHFHGPAKAGKNAPPVIPIAADALASPIKGHTMLTEAQAKELMAGDWYFNVHTAENKGGEIRGQLEPAK